MDHFPDPFGGICGLGGVIFWGPPTRNTVYFDHFWTQLTCKSTKLTYLGGMHRWLGSLIPWIRVQETGSENGRKSFKDQFSESGACIGGHFWTSGAPRWSENGRKTFKEPKMAKMPLFRHFRHISRALDGEFWQTRRRAPTGQIPIQGPWKVTKNG